MKKRKNCNSLLTAGMLSFQCPAGNGALALKKLWHLVKCVCCKCVCNPLTPPQGVDTTSYGGSQGYFQPTDISDNL